MLHERCSISWKIELLYTRQRSNRLVFGKVTLSFTAEGPIIRHCNTNCKNLYLYRVASADGARELKVLKIVKDAKPVSAKSANSSMSPGRKVIETAKGLKMPEICLESFGSPSPEGADISGRK